MRNLNSFILFFGLLPAIGSAQAPESEKGFIKEMCGCYEVDFRYAETFPEVEGYETKKPYSAKGLEWIVSEETDDEVLILQHLLVISDTMIIKHWRQDWHFENRELLEFQKGLEWSKVEVPAEKVAGTWTQKVYEVDGSPRYEGHATWVDVDGKKYWESRVAAPLPRREYTKRSDYNVMIRNNKHIITDYGHLHELDNAKVKRSPEADSVLVWEKGLNKYTKVEDSRCLPAVDWWKENKVFWDDARLVWSELIEKHSYVKIERKINGKRLYQVLFELNKEFLAEGVENYEPKKARTAIKKAIKPYLGDEPGPWAANY